MRSYRLLTPANRDLTLILEYLDRYSPLAAERFLARLHERLELLSTQPNSGRQRPEFGYDTLRSITFESYIVAYLPASRPLSIVAILHGSRDLASLLNPLVRPNT